MEAKRTENSFIQSRAGLVMSALALGLGICGAIFNVVVEDYVSILPFLAVTALGAFLVFMQLTNSKK